MAKIILVSLPEKKGQLGKAFTGEKNTAINIPRFNLFMSDEVEAREKALRARITSHHHPHRLIIFIDNLPQLLFFQPSTRNKDENILVEHDEH